jgi:DNA polymerase/3'-5' exonuclease PolX
MPTQSIVDKASSKKSASPANADIIEVFSKLARKYELEKDRGRALTYRNVVNTLKGIVEPITGSAQLKGMKGIGQNVLGKIDEYFAAVQADSDSASDSPTQS